MTPPILLVNDTKNHMDALEEYAERAGLRVPAVRAYGVPDALEILSELREILLALVDYNMHPHVGTTVIQEIRKKELTDHQKKPAFVALTSVAGDAEFERYKTEAITAGANVAINIGRTDSYKEIRALFMRLRAE